MTELALDYLLSQLQDIVTSITTSHLWINPPVIDASSDEEILDGLENDTPGLRQFKQSVQREVETLDKARPSLRITMSDSPDRLAVSKYDCTPEPFVDINVCDQCAIFHCAVGGDPSCASAGRGHREILRVAAYRHDGR